VIISQLIFSLNAKKKNIPIKIQFGGECEVEGRILQQRNKLYFALFSIKIRNSTRFCATGRIPFCTDHTQFFFFFLYWDPKCQNQETLELWWIKHRPRYQITAQKKLRIESKKCPWLQAKGVDGHFGKWVVTETVRWSRIKTRCHLCFLAVVDEQWEGKEKVMAKLEVVMKR
jgi:hypothetical protein